MSESLSDYTHAQFVDDMEELFKYNSNVSHTLICAGCGAFIHRSDETAFICDNGHRIPYPKDTSLLDAILKELEP